MLLFVGDFNTSWELTERDMKLSSFKHIVTTYGLHPSSELYTGDMNYTFSCKARSVFTWRDYIFIHVSLINNNKVQCDIFDDVVNSSDHVAKLCHLTNAAPPMGDVQVHSNVSKSCSKMYNYMVGIWEA